MDQRSGIQAVYDPMSNTDYVNALYANAGILSSQAERQSLVSALEHRERKSGLLFCWMSLRTAHSDRRNTMRRS